MPGGGGVGLAPMGVNDGVASVDNERGGDCWRNRRLQSELQNLKYDPFLGLNAVKLDPAGYTWQASVEGWSLASAAQFKDIFNDHINFPTFKMIHLKE